MGRPRKQTVDYFPHDCEHGQALFVIEQRWGNDGYAFWFKLQELLGRAEGHCLQFTTRSQWNYLCARTRLDASVCEEIMDVLADENAIDAEMWSLNRAVWSDEFVEGVADAYRKRRSEVPAKPTEFPRLSGGRNGVSSAGNPVSSGRNTVSSAVNPHTKRNESKRNETKVNETSADADFEVFWETYDHKEGKADALKAWRARRKEGRSVERIMEATANYKGVCVLTNRLMKGAAVFLGPAGHIDEWQTEGSAYQAAMVEAKRRTGAKPGGFNKFAEIEKALKKAEDEEARGG